jgi:PAS domain S-box-containing protein
MDGERRELPEPELLVQASPRMRRVMRNGAELILRDSALPAVPESVLFGNPRPSATIMCVPIRREGKTVGVLSIQSYTPRAYTPEDLQTLQALADYCGGAIARIQMEAVIQAGEERYRGLVETAFDWVWEVGPTGLYTYASSRVRALLGYTPAEVLGRSPFDLMPEAEAQRVGAIFRDLSARREPFSRLENRNRHKNGHEVVLETSGVPMLGPAGELRGYRGMDRDVTEQKQAEVLDRLQHDLTLALAGENNLIEGLRLCLNTAMAATGLDCGGFYLLDESTGALELFAHRGLSPAFVASASHYDAGSPYTRLVMAGQPLYRLFPDIGVPLPEAVQREALRILAVIPLTRHDRVIGCLNIASHTLNGIPATLRRALETIAAGATHAVARLKAEEALLEGQQRLNLALDAARMGMWDWDIVSGRLVWSPNHEALWGYPPGQFPGTYEAFQARVHPDDRSGMQQEGERAGRSRTNFQFDYRVVWPDGSVHWVSSHGRYSFDANGKAIRLVGVVYEITERRQAEDQLRLRSEQLRALTVRLEKLREEERTRMAREVHDVLGQLLTALKMDMSWWERRFTQIPDEPLRRSLEAKVQATSRLADQMIETVQKISRELRPSVLDNIGLGAALQFEARQFQERTGITCEVSVPAELAPLEPEQATGMFRIFQELLTNVARHAQATRIVVRLSRTAEFVTLKVTDNGCGIRAEELNDPQSLGLLGITERASLLGGEFRIRGAPGGGTTATLKVPAKRA